MKIEMANAKINVYLNVTARRENGYHDILSVMHTVSLSDSVFVDFLPSEKNEIFLTAEGNPNMPRAEKNIAYRAAMLFLKETGNLGCVKIHIKKRIPMAAGLAGGSTDAAAVLRALNSLCGAPLSLEQLCVLGTKLGADVPFCIRGGSALVTGIGDQMEDAPLMPYVPLVVACMGEGVSTPEAYGALDKKYNCFSTPVNTALDYSELLGAWLKNDSETACRHYFNLFEEVVPGERSCVTLLKNEMMSCGAIKSMMSGSGPSVFGVFSSNEDALHAEARLKALGATAFVCYPTKSYDTM